MCFNISFSHYLIEKNSPRDLPLLQSEVGSWLAQLAKASKIGLLAADLWLQCFQERKNKDLFVNSKQVQAIDNVFDPSTILHAET